MNETVNRLVANRTSTSRSTCGYYCMNFTVYDLLPENEDSLLAYDDCIQCTYEMRIMMLFVDEEDSVYSSLKLQKIQNLVYLQDSVAPLFCITCAIRTEIWNMSNSGCRCIITNCCSSQTSRCTIALLMQRSPNCQQTGSVVRLNAARPNSASLH